MTITVSSLRAGKREAHHAEGRTICDALMAQMPGELTFAINSQLLSHGVTATDAEVAAAVGFAFRELKLGGRARRRRRPRGTFGRKASTPRGKNIVNRCCPAAMSTPISMPSSWPEQGG